MAVLQRIALPGTPKATKQAARYTPAGGAERCGMCRHYVAPSACSRILGPISAAGWCALFSRQVTYPHHAGVQSSGVIVSAPALDLSFMIGGTLPSGVTFTRASTATYFDTAGTLQTAAINAPRWDYDRVSHALNGLLIEEARTNSIKNSMMTGAVVGSPGTDPTGWSFTTNTGVTRQIAGTGVANGLTYVDYRFTAASLTAGNFNLAFGLNSTNGIPASASQSWGQSCFVTLVAGSMPALGVAGSQLRVNQYNSGGTSVGTLISSDVGPLVGQRLAYVFGPTVANTAFLQPFLLISVLASAAPVDFTLRFAAPQLELGASVTSFVPTTAAAVTRSPDLASMPTGVWFTPASGTYQAEFIPRGAAGSLPIIVGGNAGSPVIATGSDSRLTASIRSGASVFGGIGLPYAFGAVNKAAFAYLSGASLAAVNGTSFGPGAAAFTVTGNLVEFGSDGVSPGASSLNGHLRRVRYWPRALSMPELQSVTT